MRDHQVNNFGALTQTFGNTYGAIPTSADASQADRDMSDMDDALTLDSLKTLKASDNATDLELQAADAIENSASQAAPGSAPFLTATAVASGIRSQALTQKMLAAELRQEAAHIAHQNGFRKRGATFTTQLRGSDDEPSAAQLIPENVMKSFREALRTEGSWILGHKLRPLSSAAVLFRCTVAGKGQFIAHVARFSRRGCRAFRAPCRSDRRRI